MRRRLVRTSLNARWFFPSSSLLTAIRSVTKYYDTIALLQKGVEQRASTRTDVSRCNAVHSIIFLLQLLRIPQPSGTILL